ncbi:MAG: alpha/beta hydrolase [Acutalibacteraceae bacterium]
MNIVIPLMELFWSKVVKKQDDARIATLSEPDGLTQVCDIPYINDGDKMHLLDIYYPENADKKLPVIIDIHGGGWMYGDKELNKMYCLSLAKRGFAVFNISYRLVPQVSVGQQLQDCACALRWISENMSEYPCDKEHIMLTGDSAGGMLAAYSAALMSSAELRDIFDTVDPKMELEMLTLTSPVAYMNDKGIMSAYTKTMWGKTGKSQRTAPYMNLDSLFDKAKFPPTVMVTSSGDFMANEQTRRAANDFKKNNIPVKLIDFDTFEGKDLEHVFAVLLPDSRAGKLCIDNYINCFRDLIGVKAVKTKAN